MIISYRGANIFSDQLSNVVFLSYYFILHDVAVFKKELSFVLAFLFLSRLGIPWYSKLRELHLMVILISRVQWHKLYVHRRCFGWHQNLKSSRLEWLTFRSHVSSFTKTSEFFSNIPFQHTYLVLRHTQMSMYIWPDFV